MEWRNEVELESIRLPARYVLGEDYFPRGCWTFVGNAELESALQSPRRFRPQRMSREISFAATPSGVSPIEIALLKGLSGNTCAIKKQCLLPRLDAKCKETLSAGLNRRRI